MEPLKKILLCLRNVFTKKDDSVIPTDFSDLAPLDSIDNTSEYLNALDWALKNRRIRNVALCGPYGAGKSSIINSYLKSHADAQQKSLRISMATFIESKTEGSDSSHSVALKPDEIETGILKQLFYKVPHTKIPQSRYRKLHKGGKLIAWRNLVLISIFLLLLGFIFAPDHEFIIYKNTLQAEPNLELSDESMMALMVFKNLYPKEFAELQKEQGIVKQAFRDKVRFVNIETTSLNKEIANSSEILEKIQQDNLQNVKELKVAMLYAAVGNAQIMEIGQYSYDSFMQADFDFSVLTKADQQQIYFYKSYSSRYEQKDSSFFQPYYERWQHLRYAGENRISEQKANVENAKKQIHDISKLSLCELIEKYGASVVLSEDVRKNQLLVFLLRRGYIDEKYIYYINYFKGSSITNDDMNFILAVKTHTLLEPSYHLEKTSNIVNKLQP